MNTDKILTTLSDPTWIFSVVIAGFVINLFSSYTRNIIDYSFSFFRKKSTNIIEKYFQDLNNQSHTTEQDQVILIIISSSIVPLYFETFILLMLASYGLVIGTNNIARTWFALIPILLSLFVLIFAFSRSLLANKRSLMLEKILNRRIENVSQKKHNPPRHG